MIGFSNSGVYFDFPIMRHDNSQTFGFTSKRLFPIGLRRLKTGMNPAGIEPAASGFARLRSRPSELRVQVQDGKAFNDESARVQA